MLYHEIFIKSAKYNSVLMLQLIACIAFVVSHSRSGPLHEVINPLHKVPTSRIGQNTFVEMNVFSSVVTTVLIIYMPECSCDLYI